MLNVRARIFFISGIVVGLHYRVFAQEEGLFVRNCWIYEFACFLQKLLFYKKFEKVNEMGAKFQFATFTTALLHWGNSRCVIATKLDKLFQMEHLVLESRVYNPASCAIFCQYLQVPVLSSLNLHLYHTISVETPGICVLVLTVH